MSRLNVQTPSWAGFPPLTHEGAPAKRITPLQQLRRSVMSCFLWEKEFYEDGMEISQRIAQLAEEVSPAALSTVAIDAKEQGLRHAPLMLASLLAKKISADPHKAAAARSLAGLTIEEVVDRADSMAEFLAIHAHVNGTTPDKLKKVLSKQMKLGLAAAFQKFDAYQLGKYNRDAAIKMRDVMFLVHPKPKDEEQAAVWKKLVDGTLEAPDTWEVALSAGEDKKATWERLLREGKLGYLALLRNLRNMDQAGVSEDLIRPAIIMRKGAHKVQPFRYIAAANAAPRFAKDLNYALCETVRELPMLSGKTIVLVDVSGSMDEKLSAKSDLTRIDAAATLASVINSDCRIFTFSESVVEVPHFVGLPGIEAIKRSQYHSGTYLGRAVAHVNQFDHDRLIVITDEQSHDKVGDPRAKRAYMINVASAKNGVGYGRWTHIDGFSENVLKWIGEVERELYTPSPASE